MVSRSLIFGCHVGTYQGYAWLDRSFLTVLAFEEVDKGPALLVESEGVVYHISICLGTSLLISSPRL